MLWLRKTYWRMHLFSVLWECHSVKSYLVCSNLRLLDCLAWHQHVTICYRAGHAAWHSAGQHRCHLSIRSAGWSTYLIIAVRNIGYLPCRHGQQHPGVQVKLIQRSLPYDAQLAVQVSTVDAFQGSEREVGEFQRFFLSPTGSSDNRGHLTSR